METGHCALCKAMITWATTVNGGIIALNADPDPEGDVIVVAGKAHVCNGSLFEEMVEGLRYKQHSATCTQTAHRRKRQ